MSTIFRKTAKGVAEIETRAHRLSPRMRSLLILVDGKRDSEDLKQFVAQQAEESLKTLLEQGFIEAVGETVRSAAVAVAEPAPAYAGYAGYAASGGGPASEPPVDLSSLRKAAGDLLALRKAAVRALADQLGPSADSLSVRMEKAKTLAELQPLLGQAAQLVLAARGRAAAEAYAERFPSK
jgi:hypothetical protein